MNVYSEGGRLSDHIHGVNARERERGTQTHSRLCGRCADEHGNDTEGF